MATKRGPSLVAVCVFVVLAALTVGASWIVRRGIERQDRDLLREQAGEAVLRLERTVEETSLGLGSVGVEPKVFEKQATAMRAEATTTVALISKGKVVGPKSKVAPGALRVAAVVGPGLRGGERLTGQLLAIALGARPTLSASPVIHLAGKRYVVFSIVPPSIGIPGYLALEVREVFPQRLSPLNGPYPKLDLALYATAKPQSDQLIASTIGQKPFPKRTVTTPLKVGSLEWAAVGAANAPMLDTPAQTTPWALLAGGLVLALAVAITIETLVRRQRWQRNDADTQRRNIQLMQFALLPETVPALNGVSVGWHYQAGGEPWTPVGGDWLAFVPVSGDRAGMAVGDVAGHGLDAVRNMAQYRFALRTLATRTASPCEVLDQVDDTARIFDITHFSTCVYGVIDTTQSTWTYCVAGHPAPLLVRDGKAESLQGPHGAPLSLNGGRPKYAEHTVRLKAGDLLALYSDGLIERRFQPLSDGVERLGTRLLDVKDEDDLTEVSTAVVADLVGSTPPDDVVIILARYTP